MPIFLTLFPNFQSRTKPLWITLIVVMRAVCHYYDRNKEGLPDDLPAEVGVALAALEAACEALKEYDLAHKRGRYQKPGNAN